jgi:hypothetical protein
MGVAAAIAKEPLRQERLPPAHAQPVLPVMHADRLAQLDVLVLAIARLVTAHQRRSSTMSSFGTWVTMWASR